MAATALVPERPAFKAARCKRISPSFWSPRGARASLFSPRLRLGMERITIRRVFYRLGASLCGNGLACAGQARACLFRRELRLIDRMETSSTAEMSRHDDLRRRHADRG